MSIKTKCKRNRTHHFVTGIKVGGPAVVVDGYTRGRRVRGLVDETHRGRGRRLPRTVRHYRGRRGAERVRVQPLLGTVRRGIRRRGTVGQSQRGRVAPRKSPGRSLATLARLGNELSDAGHSQLFQGVGVQVESS